MCWLCDYRLSARQESVCSVLSICTWAKHCVFSLKMRNQLYCNKSMLNLTKYAVWLYSSIVIDR